MAQARKEFMQVSRMNNIIYGNNSNSGIMHRGVNGKINVVVEW